MTAIRSVVFDVDSTLTGIEGVDWLAALRGPAVGERVAALTNAAMDGSISLDAVYGERLALVRPSAADLTALATAYVQQAAPGVAAAVQALRGRGLRVIAISGGLAPAVRAFCETIGIAAQDVHAVGLAFDDEGAYAGFDASSPLVRRGGKPQIVEALRLPREILAVGDGSTDLEMRRVVDRFCAYVGFVERPAVVAAADVVARSFDDVLAIALGGDGR